MEIKISHRGSFSKTERFLRRALHLNLRPIFERYGMLGVESLALATPVDTGETRASWHYKLEENPSGYTLSWYNDKMAGDVPLVILIQYGHGTRSGAFVQGINFINPAIGSILEEISDDIWKEVTIV